MGTEGFSRKDYQPESKMLCSNVKFSSEHWLRIRTNNVIERVNRELRHHTRVIGTFPDGEMLVCARLRYIASNDWGKKPYLNMKHLTDMFAEELYCEARIS